MAKQWKCARCSTKNPESTLTCGTCRMIRGAVVVPGSYESLPQAPAPHVEWPSWMPSESPAAPVSSEWARHASQRPPLLARIPVVIVIGVLVLIAGGVGVFYSAGRSPAGEIVNAGTLVVNDLQVGDCFDLAVLPSGEFNDVTARPCADEHQYELFWTGSMPDGKYPSESAFESFFDEHCYDAFAKYVGVGYADTRLDIYWVVPNENAWTLGDRFFQCSVFDPSNPRMTNSLKGSGGPELQPLDL